MDAKQDGEWKAGTGPSTYALSQPYSQAACNADFSGAALFSPIGAAAVLPMAGQTVFP